MSMCRKPKNENKLGTEELCIPYEYIWLIILVQNSEKHPKKRMNLQSPKVQQFEATFKKKMKM